MTDILLRNLSDEDVAGIDSRAAKVGLSRSEYLRRLVRRDVNPVKVTVADLERFSKTFADLRDPDVMSGAWD